MHLCVYSSIIYNSQDTETISMSTNRLMDEDVVYAHNGILLSHKKWNNAICSSISEQISYYHLYMEFKIWY